MYKPKTNITALLALTLAITTIIANVGSAYAATLTTGSLILSNSLPSGVSQYTVSAGGFTTATAIGCIEVDLGTATDGTGAITGLSTASSTFVSQSITASGTWTVDNTQSANHVMRFVNATPVNPQSGTQTAVFGAVTNGSVVNTSYVGVIKTYTTNACSTPVDTTTVNFIYTAGQAVTMSVDGTLSFSVAGIAGTGANTVNSTNLTSGVTSTSTTLPFGTITTASNKVAAQDLTVTTNAGTGYTVYTRYTGPLSAGTGKDLADLAGAPNTTPITFPAATEAFGYTTEDFTLGTGTTSRFRGNKWAAFTTTNAEVIYNAAAISNQTTRVGFQAGITGTTKPGAYATTVVYTATPSY